MEARLHEVTQTIEHQEQLAQRRHSEVLTRVRMLEVQAATSSSERPSLSCSAPEESQLTLASPLVTLRRDVEAQLEHHDIRLRTAEAELWGVDGELAQLKEQLSALQSTFARQE